MRNFFVFKFILFLAFIALIHTETSLKTATSTTLGSYITDGNNMALYVYKDDKPNNSTCTGQCLVAWPPLVIEKSQTVSAASSSSISGVIGYISYNTTFNLVTVNSFPLYYYNKDTPNTVLGQYVNNGKWFIVHPNGRVNFSNPSLLATTITSGATLMLSSKKAFGDYYLTDNKGVTLYMFEKDDFMKSNCFAQCAVNWPPYLRTGNAALTVGPGVDSTLIAYASRKDPTSGAETQIYTYNGYPLYYYVGEVDQPGLVSCQNIDMDGGYWWIMLANGSINLEGKTSATSANSQIPWLKITTNTNSSNSNYLSFGIAIILLLIVLI